MENPTQQLLRLLTPTKAAIAAEIHSTAGTLRNLANGAAAGPSMRHRLVRFAEDHVREIQGAIEAVRATLPASPSDEGPVADEAGLADSTA